MGGTFLPLFYVYLLTKILNSSQIVEEAGGAVTCMDGGKFSVFDRSVLVSNGLLHDKVRNVVPSSVPSFRA